MTISTSDSLMRLPFLGWVLLSAIAQIMALRPFMNTAASIDPSYLIDITMRLSTVVFFLLMAAAVILRTTPSKKASGFEPRVSALIGTFILYSIVLFPRHDLSASAEVISASLMMIGNVGAVAALARLGRSFSLMAETRQLVTSGPYRFVRHPLYLAEEIATIGLFMQFASFWTAVLVVVQFVFQLRRMHNEEAVLSKTFPQYTTYRLKTARLIPGLY
jgi:protein-S-isoprenylcysteine O-methyltransferase Ste14